jgi:hypothetical protein
MNKKTPVSTTRSTGYSAPKKNPVKGSVADRSKWVQKINGGQWFVDMCVALCMAHYEGDERRLAEREGLFSKPVLAYMLTWCDNNRPEVREWYEETKPKEQTFDGEKLAQRVRFQYVEYEDQIIDGVKKCVRIKEASRSNEHRNIRPTLDGGRKAREAHFNNKETQQ